MYPKISVITVTLNAERFLEQTIQSVIEQTYPFFEYIVVDGQSTDNTLAIIKSYEHALTWISEPDKGIADAMNKGVALASGELILFVHADDYLLQDDCIVKVVNKMEGNHCLYACTVVFQTRYSSVGVRPRPWNGWVVFKNPFCHQGVLCRKKLFEVIGLFDTQLAITMDYDFLLRAYRKGYTVQRIDATLAVMRDTGLSSRRDWCSLARRLREERFVHWKNRCGKLDALVYFVYWPLYWSYRRLKYLLFL